MENYNKVFNIKNTNEIQKKRENMISAISSINQIPPYKDYIINNIDKILNDKIIIKNIFIQENVLLDQIFNDFKNGVKKKNEKFKKSNDNNNKLKIPIFGNINNFTQSTINNPNSNISNKSSQLLSDKSKKSKNSNIEKKELKNFEDSFNLNGSGFEFFAQSIIFQTLICLNSNLDNKFHFFCNIKQDMKKIIHDIELDFLITDLDKNVFKLFIKYFKYNFVFMNYNKNIFLINDSDSKSIDNIMESIDNIDMIDILGEIGLEAWKDNQKNSQFIKYCKLLELEKDNTNEVISQLHEKVGINAKNEKLILFITNSSFIDIYNDINKTDLYKNMNNKTINSAILFLTNDIIEQKVLLKNILDGNIPKNIITRINLDTNNYLENQKFKKPCLILNDLLIILKNDESINSINKVQKKLENILSLFFNYINNNFYFNNKIKFKDQIFNDDKILGNNKRPVINIFHFTYNQNKDEELFSFSKNTNYYNFSLDKNNNEKISNVKGNNTNRLNRIQFIVIEVEYSLILQYINEIDVCKNDFIIYKENYESLDKYELFKNYRLIKFKEKYNLRNIIINLIDINTPIIIEINENKIMYDFLIKIYLEERNTKIIEYCQDNEFDNLYNKLKEDIYFMLNLSVDDKNTDIININTYMFMYKEGCNKIIQEIYKEVFDNKISSFIDLIKNIINYNKNQIEDLRKKMEGLFSQVIASSIIRFTLIYFKETIVPLISQKIWEIKLGEKIMKDK